MTKCATTVKNTKRSGIVVKKRSKTFRNLIKKLLAKQKADKAASKKVVAKKPESKIMTSFSDPSKSYVVSATSCTCPDYKYRRQHRGESCKHMRAFQKTCSHS